MKHRDETQILGALPLSFGQACINFKFLIAEETHFLEQIKAEEWCALFSQELYSPQGHIISKTLEELSGQDCRPGQLIAGIYRRQPCVLSK